MNLDLTAARAMLVDPHGPCSHWGNPGWCGATDDLRLYLIGRRCPRHAPVDRVPSTRPAVPAAEQARPETPRPIVMVDSRDGAPVPDVAGAARLVKAAEAAGWTARSTYAVAEMPATSRRAAHHLATVTVRLAADAVRGWACWHQVDEGAWRFAEAWLGARRLGARELTTVLFEVSR